MVALVALACTQLFFGCATVDPPGWDGREKMANLTLNAKPWVMYGVAPHAWVSPLGELRIEQQPGLVTVGPRTDGYTFKLRFHQQKPILVCQIYVDPQGPLARHQQTHGALFGCSDAGGTLILSVGMSCRYPNDLNNPTCHQGTLRLGGQSELRVRQGYFKSYGMPIGRLSFTTGDGQLLGVADIVSEVGIRFWAEPSTAHERQRELALVVAAIHQFHHTIQYEH